MGRNLQYSNGMVMMVLIIWTENCCFGVVWIAFLQKLFYLFHRHEKDQVTCGLFGCWCRLIVRSLLLLLMLSTLDSLILGIYNYWGKVRRSTNMNGNHALTLFHEGCSLAASFHEKLNVEWHRPSLVISLVIDVTTSLGLFSHDTRHPTAKP